jgi:hypothetical protein
MKHMQTAAENLKPVRNLIYHREPTNDGQKMVLLKKTNGLWLKDQNPKTN